MAGYISVQVDLGMLIRTVLFAPACYREWYYIHYFSVTV